MKPVDRKKWRREWDESEVKELCLLSDAMIARGAISEEAAWYAAEESLPTRSSPYLKRDR